MNKYEICGINTTQSDLNDEKEFNRPKIRKNPRKSPDLATFSRII